MIWISICLPPSSIHTCIEHLTIWVNLLWTMPPSFASVEKAPLSSQACQSSYNLQAFNYGGLLWSSSQSVSFIFLCSKSGYYLALAYKHRIQINPFRYTFLSPRKLTRLTAIMFLILPSLIYDPHHCEGSENNFHQSFSFWHAETNRVAAKT